MGGHIVTQYGPHIQNLMEMISGEFPDPPGHLGGVHPAPGVGPRQGQAQE